jgi:hypothetical protein
VLKEDIDEYIVFRTRISELLHLWRAWTRYGKLPDDDLDREITPTIAMASMVWLHSFFDKNPNDLNVLLLWPRVFPSMKASVEAWRAAHEDVFELLKEFRHTTGAHFSRKIEDHNRVREAFDNESMAKAVAAFIEIAVEAMKHETEEPALLDAIEKHGLPPGYPRGDR